MPDQGLKKKPNITAEDLMDLLGTAWRQVGAFGTGLGRGASFGLTKKLETPEDIANIEEFPSTAQAGDIAGMLYGGNLIGRAAVRPLAKLAGAVRGTKAIGAGKLASGIEAANAPIGGALEGAGTQIGEEIKRGGFDEASAQRIKEAAGIGAGINTAAGLGFLATKPMRKAGARFFQRKALPSSPGAIESGKDFAQEQIDLGIAGGRKGISQSTERVLNVAENQKNKILDNFDDIRISGESIASRIDDKIAAIESDKLSPFDKGRLNALKEAANEIRGQSFSPRELEEQARLIRKIQRERRGAQRLAKSFKTGEQAAIVESTGDAIDEIRTDLLRAIPENVDSAIEAQSPRIARKLKDVRRKQSVALDARQAQAARIKNIRRSEADRGSSRIASGLQFGIPALLAGGATAEMELSPMQRLAVMAGAGGAGMAATSQPIATRMAQLLTDGNTIGLGNTLSDQVIRNAVPNSAQDIVNFLLQERIREIQPDNKAGGSK